MVSALSLVVCAIVFVQQFGSMECKLQKGSIVFGGSQDDDNWQFVSKFGFAIGEGRYRMRTRLLNASALPRRRYLDFHVFLDEQWGKVEALSSCNERISQARRTQHLYLAHAGEWTSWTAGSVSQKVRPHIWYFAASMCNQHLGGSALAFEYEIHMTQVDGSEFSVEMRSMMSWNSIVLACLAIFIARFSARSRTFADSAGGLHQVIWVLIVAIALQFIAQAFHTAHLWGYQADGIGIKSLDMLSEILFMLSQVVQTTLLIAIAMGYTLLQGRDGHMVIVRWIALFSLVIHVSLVSFGKSQDESACKYHENEGFVGWILLSVRLMLLYWFLFATQASQKQAGLRLHDFFQHFRLAGSMYFLAYPLLFILVKVFAPYLQHPIMHIGLQTMQTASVIWLAELFLSRGTYFKVSALSTSLLPGNHSADMFCKTS